MTFTRNPNLQQNTPVLADTKHIANATATSTSQEESAAATTATVATTATSATTATATAMGGGGGGEHSGRQEVVGGEEDWVVNLRGTEDEWLQQAERPEWWFTGLRPELCPGFDSERGVLTSLAMPCYAEDGRNRQRLRDYFDNTWTLTEVLFSCLRAEEAFYRPPYHQLRHPLIFYLCHPAALYINKLRVAGLLAGPLQPYYEEIFETGVDEMSWDDLSKNSMRWPSLQEAIQYRRDVYAAVVALLDSHPDIELSPFRYHSPHIVWALATEHERIHIETSSVLMRELPIRLVQFPKYWPNYHPIVNAPQNKVPTKGVDYPENEIIPVAGGQVTLGKPIDFPSFGWDNEYGSRTFKVRPFKASKLLISNGQFLEFVKDGGYRNMKYWTRDGWGWRSFRNAKWPTFWVLDGPAGLHQYKLRLCFDIVDMPWSLPVDVNYHEAKAFCNWYTQKTGSSVPYYLLTEPQHHMIRDESTRDLSLGNSRDPVTAASGSEMPKKFNLNLNLAYGSQSPVNDMAPNDKGFHDVFGNAWQWCEDYFCALDGFAIHNLYDDFSTPCFDGEHNIIMGGSFVSTGDEASIFARFHFRPHFFQHSSFRLSCPADENPERDITSCTNCPPPHTKSLPWGNAKVTADQDSALNIDSRRLLNMYMDLHYGQDSTSDLYMYSPLDAVNYPVRLVERIRQVATENSLHTTTALDVGCGVGRSTFALSEFFDEVVGLDINPSYVHIAEKLQRGASVDYERMADGNLTYRVTAKLPESAQPRKIRFETNDASSITSGSYNLILLSNILCQSPHSKTILANLAGESSPLLPGGLLVIATPFTSVEDKATETKTGSSVRSLEDITSYLDHSFDLVHESTLPMLLREHSRKFGYFVCSIYVFQRKNDQ